MLLSGVPRVAASLLNPSLSRQVFGSFRLMSSGPFQEKERAEETIHFRKEDEKLLRKLLQKVKTQADQADKHEAESHEQEERSFLKKVLGEKVTDAQIEALLGWKHQH
eukprot:jgi/Botrbrau1/7443/Bobra.0083s0016.1